MTKSLDLPGWGLGAEARTRLVAVLQHERDYLQNILLNPKRESPEIRNRFKMLDENITGHLDRLLELEI